MTNVNDLPLQRYAYPSTEQRYHEKTTKENAFLRNGPGRQQLDL